jgi:glycosyltransferase involved in cell wall biosynthesis
MSDGVLPRRILQISYTRLDDARKKGIISDEPRSLLPFYNPGNRFELSIIFVPFGKEDIDIYLTPTIRYVETRRKAGRFALFTHALLSVRTAKRLITDHRLEACRINGPNTSAALAMALRQISSVPMLVFIEAFWEQIISHQHNIPASVRRLMPAWYRLVYKSFDAYCGTPSLDPNMYAGFGMDRRRIADWRNELDLQLLQETADRMPVPDAVLAASHPRCVAVGRLHPEKLTLDLLDMLAELRREVPTATLVLVGAGDLADEVLRRADNLGLGKDVILTGALDTASAFAVVQNCDIVTAPMQGSALIEAMAAGKPIVAYSNSTHEKHISDGRNGILVPDRDPEAMAHAAAALWKNPDLMKSISASAHAHAWDRHGPDAVTKSLLDGFRLAVQIKNEGVSARENGATF